MASCRGDLVYQRLQRDDLTARAALAAGSTCFLREAPARRTCCRLLVRPSFVPAKPRRASEFGSVLVPCAARCPARTLFCRKTLQTAPGSARLPIPKQDTCPRWQGLEKYEIQFHVVSRPADSCKVFRHAEMRKQWLYPLPPNDLAGELGALPGHASYH
jgi:hypothetical protein